MPHKKKKNKKSLINNNNDVMTSNLENKENVVIPVIQMVSHPLGSCISMISYQELCKQYKQLESENKKLTDKLLTSSETNIETLVNENKSLKERIEILLHENKDLINQNKELSKCIVELKQKNEELSKHIIELKNENKQLKAKMLAHNLKISISDINEIYKLEQTNDIKFNKSMKRIRHNRHSDSHYIRTKEEPDSEEMKQYKMILTRDKLIEHNKYNNTFPKQLIDIINSKITIKKFNIDEEDKLTADEWWDS